MAKDGNNIIRPPCVKLGVGTKLGCLQRHPGLTASVFSGAVLAPGNSGIFTVLYSGEKNGSRGDSAAESGLQGLYLQTCARKEQEFKQWVNQNQSRTSTAG